MPRLCSSPSLLFIPLVVRFSPFQVSRWAFSPPPPTSGCSGFNGIDNVSNKLRMTTPNKTPPGADPKQLERTATVREIGSQAVWSLSSCKPGFGVDQLRDDNLETYWQSDGSQPHLVNIQFRRKTTVKTLCIYADYKSDESYTPSKISVRVGNNFHNLQEIRNLEAA
ncbi:anaphase-promoting complex subunit 10 isoform X2 [Cricetulus griseus]|uniref:Anaphase-promoting complex subunit 10 n=1 Tax=Cricetulus griseus TaxID=10029 RepID=A0A9J7FLL5_CRIGR|nr:anaphase-promoting complex subunit 10 isoform X2 [Cricetulus griseus]XP_027291250.1 anaphase-promoting complex subunit 10 isoform X2 [Cricetulus griseus]